MRQSSIIRTGALGLMVFWLLGQGLRAAGAPDDKPAAPQERLEALKRESEQIYGRMEARRPGPRATPRRRRPSMPTSRPCAASPGRPSSCWASMATMTGRPPRRR